MPELTLSDLADAYGSDDASPPLVDALGNPVYVIPKEWTPAHVLNRLVDAFGVIQRIVAKPGPKAFGTAWPPMMVEFADLLDENARRLALAEKDKEAARGGKPNKLQISMGEEAIHWPIRYLAGLDLQSDALRLWLLAQTESFNLERVLSRRRLVAEELVRLLAGKPEAPKLDVDQLRATARGVVASTNVLLDRAREAARAARSERQLAAARADADYARKRARERFSKIAHRERLIERAKVQKIPLTEVMPGKVLHRQTLDKMRWEAAGIVAAELRKARVLVR